MESPKHLTHKPIISISDYETKDGQYINSSDARALSIGKAQYDQDEITLKVFRHTGTRWSRQSEELPLHRNIDLNILLVSTLLKEYKTKDFDLIIDDESNVDLIHQYYDDYENYLKPRLEELHDKLTKFLKK
ncbi:DUF6530 family protein [Empedobacter brevis]|uniref:DUF6530 family protein n=1 Tax=Empedobacter brevis TaxID=247 RepID=UPI0028ACB31A|nr:DUF6530 family protein [Empedobacter brevis]